MSAVAIPVAVLVASLATVPVIPQLGTPAAQGSAAANGFKKAPRVVELTVTKQGFTPKEVKLKKDEPVKLVITRKVEKTCATEIVIKDQDIRRDLPLNQPVEITFTPKKAGTIRYGCAMDMITGVLAVE